MKYISFSFLLHHYNPLDCIILALTTLTIKQTYQSSYLHTSWHTPIYVTITQNIFSNTSIQSSAFSTFNVTNIHLISNKSWLRLLYLSLFKHFFVFDWWFIEIILSFLYWFIVLIVISIVLLSVLIREEVFFRFVKKHL